MGNLTGLAGVEGSARGLTSCTTGLWKFDERNMHNDHHFPPMIAGFQARLLTFSDLPALQNLMEQCSDYVELVSGSPPSTNEAEMLVASLPPGKTLDDKYIFGVFNVDGELAGILDAVKDYPGERDWWVGLQLLSPDNRGKGTGGQLYQAFENWALAQGARQIQLGVLETNPRAYLFWERLGFELVEKRPSRDGSNHQVLVMRRLLAPD
jgi:GNAT superfamily N-acetyltransferase